MSETTPVSSSRTSAAPAEGATPKTGSSVGTKLDDGGSDGGGLAGAGGADDEDELLVAGDAGGGVGLGDVEVDCRSGRSLRVRRRRRRRGALGPVEEVVLLVEDRLRGQRPVDGRL